MINNKAINLLISFLLIGLLMFVTWFVYSPGLFGGYIFDDYHSLKKLAVLEGELNVQNLLTYFSLSDTGPLKRPISVFSFLIDAQDWPAQPYSFKFTNLMIHLLNGFLLFFLIRQIFGHHIKFHKSKLFLAFFTAGFWLLHPFLLSTTLYIVQRMAMLPLTFMLLGMICYLYGRVKYSQKASYSRILILCVAVFGGTTLAMLSKENGVLFIFLVLLFEVFIVQKFLAIRPLNKNLSWLILKIPALLLLAALIYKIPDFMVRYDERDFNILDRQLTQFRALSDYLYHLFIPKYFTYGVFTDGYPVSKGLFSPLSTLFAGIFIIGLLASAWLLRNRYVWFSFAIFFYFIAQLLESTIIPLEMYFEHRVYVASIFLPVPLLLIFLKLIKRSKIYFLVPLAILGYLAFLTLLRSNMWSDNFKMHEMTMKKFPESARVFTATADFYARSGYRDFAYMTLDSAIKHHDNLEFKLNRALLMCGDEILTDDYMSLVLQSFNEVKFNPSDWAAFTALYRKLLRYECGLDKNQGYGLKLYEAMKNNSFKETNHAKVIIRAYGVYYELEKENFDRAREMMEILIKEDKRYLDTFEMFDVLTTMDQYQMIGDLLPIVRETYENDPSKIVDFEFIDDKIKFYEELYLSKMEE